MRVMALLACPVTAFLLSGCSVTKSSLYPGTAQTPNLQEQGVQLLGEVTACQGAFCKKEDGGYEWPMSLPQPPPAYTYQRAIQKKAATHYGVPEAEILVGEIAVGYHAEMIGTIRGWEATAMVGRKQTREAAR
jgi:hypothetical protein